MKNNFATLLVIGNDHQLIAQKYSKDRAVEPYIAYMFDDMEKIHSDDIKLLESMINELKPLVEKNGSNDYYSELVNDYNACKSMTDFEYYQEMTRGCWYDDNGNAWSTENPNAHYQYEKCYDRRIKMNQEDEAPFAIPFILKDGTKAYSAKKSDIDWKSMHMANIDTYRRAWKLCVDDETPENVEEDLIKKSFSNRNEYFSNFKNEDEYVLHNCAFWAYGVATMDKYECIEDLSDRMKWVESFYDTYIKPSDDDTIFTIYEIKILD